MKKLLYFFGFRYLVNKRTKEIHRLNSQKEQCAFRYMTWRNKKVIHQLRLKKHLQNGHNGCRYCLKQYDTD
jgi:hypothetical protein